MTAFEPSAFEAPLVMPELHSGPAQLRPWLLTDLPLIRQAACDPYIPAITSVPAVYSDGEGRAFIERQHALARGGHGYSLVIADVSDVRHGAGSLGLWLNEIEFGRASIGYWIASTARGRNLAGWALRGMVTFAFDVLEIPRLQLFIEPWNIASQRTAEFAGFTREALLRGWERIGDAQHDAYAYALLRAERPTYSEGKSLDA
jgi:ribosomal-protein-alanine N-acetyltransferase